MPVLPVASVRLILWPAMNSTPKPSGNSRKNFFDFHLFSFQAIQGFIYDCIIYTYFTYIPGLQTVIDD